LVVLAGLCAPLGACCVLFMKHSHMRLLSGSIALAAGVMLFISLTEVRARAVSGTPCAVPARSSSRASATCKRARHTPAPHAHNTRAQHTRATHARNVALVNKHRC
jgi:hypothetical protein